MIGLKFAASAGRRRAAHAIFSKLLSTIAAALPVVVVAGSASLVVGMDSAEAKGPGRTYCFYKTCHRVKTIAETKALIGRDMTLTASFYDSCKKDKFNPCGLTSSGARFEPGRADNAASPILPDGTVALVWSDATGEAVVLRINNAGPYWGDRKLDLSRAAAQKLGVKGVGKVKLRVLKAPTDAEARYVKNCVYEAVPGPIGKFASLDAAHGAMSVMVAMGLPSTKGLAGATGAPAIALAANGAAESVDPASDLTVAFKSPIVPRFDVPDGGFKSALLAQVDVEGRLRASANVATASPVALTREASIDARPLAASVTPVAAAQAVTAVAPPRRSLQSEPLSGKTIRSADVAPVKAETAPAPVRAKPKARSAKAAVETPKPVRRAAKRSEKAKTQMPATAARVTATRKPTVSQQPSTKMRSARARHEAETGEIRVGFTTYAEERYRKPAKVAGLRKAKTTKTAKGGAKITPPPATALAAGQPGPSRVKRAQLPKSHGRSAALKKAGGWQSSAILERSLRSSDGNDVDTHSRTRAADPGR